MRTGSSGASIVPLLVLLAISASLAARTPDLAERQDAAASGPAVIWRDPGDVAALNLFYGAGGQAHAPRPQGTFSFVKEVPEGATVKFDVIDDAGVRWRVKLGHEAQPETAATRLLWAAGYFTDEDYYLADLTVQGLPTLTRGQEHVLPGGVVHRARLERLPADLKIVGGWDWVDNPFHDTREFHGLCVMMSLLNNWDMSTSNNAIYDVGGERRYVVTDLGASLGNAGDSVTESKGVPNDYARSPFIEATTPDVVDFALRSRLFMESAAKLSYYAQLVKVNGATKQIPRADARWLGQRLAMLSGEQIRDAFRAAGCTPEEIDLYARIVQGRIAQLLAL
jgi:hypothetical protein